MKILRVLLFGLAFVVVALLAVIVGARFADGPIALIPGGQLESGELVADPAVDWTFAKDVQEIEMESDGRSRTVWALVVNGELYIPASTSFPPFKSWHKRIAQEPRARVRIEGKRYERALQRVEDPALLTSLREAALQKYAPPPGTSPEDVWFFHAAAPRPS